jgi:L-fuculose-phosphate aldolase
MTIGQARSITVEASHALAAAGQGDMVWGHVAVRDPSGRGIWIKAPGWGLEEVANDRIQLVSFDGQVLDGAPGSPHKECAIHLELMRADPETACTVHSHARAAVAFAALDTPLLPLSHEGTLFAGADVPRYRATGGLITTPELGRALAETLGGAPAALLPKHGLAAAGESVPAAVMHAVLLEGACRVQLEAMAAGPVRIHSDAEEARAKRDTCWAPSQIEAGWRYLTRLARRAPATG